MSVTNELRSYIRNLIQREMLIIKDEESNYQTKFKTALKRFGVTSPDQLSDTKKKEFFNFMDASHDAGENETDIDEAKDPKLLSIAKKLVKMSKSHADTICKGKGQPFADQEDVKKYLKNNVDETSLVAEKDDGSVPLITSSRFDESQKKKEILKRIIKEKINKIKIENSSKLLNAIKQEMHNNDYKYETNFPTVELRIIKNSFKNGYVYIPDNVYRNTSVLSVLNKLIKKYKINESVDETSSVSGMGGGDAFNTPNAFAKSGKHSKRALDKSKFKKVKDIDESVDFKNTELTPGKRMNQAVSTMRNSLREINKLLNKSSKFKQEAGVTSDKYWTRTKTSLTKISEELVTIMNKLNNIK